jgi:DNA-binding GntR family transcriptional regulator
MTTTLRTASSPPDSGPPAAGYGELPGRIYDQLREEIVRGRLPAGARLTEAELARRFGVSRTPVREVLARLAQESYVVTAGSGRRTRFQVAPLNRELIPELWGIIGAMEALAVQSVATMDPGERAALAAELERLNAELEAAAAVRPRDIDRIGHLMSEFHLRFMDRCAGALLRPLYDGVRSHVQRYEWAYGAQQGTDYGPSVDEHRGIIAAIAAGDARAARERVERHWADGLERTVASLGHGRPGG